MPPQQSNPTPPGSPAAGPQNLPPPTEPGGVQPAGGTVQPANPQPAPLPAETAAQAPPAAQPLQPTGEPGPQGQPPGNTQGQGTGAEQARQQSQQAISQSNEILITARTVRPFMPDILTIDRAKVTVAKKSLSSASESMSIRVEDLLNVTANTGLFFGVVYISNRVAGGDKPTVVGPFWREQALRIKRITQGYVIAIQREIDVSQLSCNELKTMLEKLGEDDHGNTAAG